MAEELSQHATGSKDLYLAQWLKEKKFDPKKVLGTSQYQSVLAAERGLQTPATTTKKTPPSQTTSQRARSQSGIKTKRASQGKAGPSRKKQKGGDEEEEDPAVITPPKKPASSRQRKEREQTELTGKFNLVMKKGREQHYLGFAVLDPAVLREPYPNTEDRGEDPAHVEDIADEIRYHNTYATPQIFTVSIIASPALIQEFTELWKDREDQRVAC
jgi:hypothetical protein